MRLINHISHSSHPPELPSHSSQERRKGLSGDARDERLTDSGRLSHALALEGALVEVSCESLHYPMPLAQAPAVCLQRPGAELWPECLASCKLWPKISFPPCPPCWPSSSQGSDSQGGSYAEALGVFARWPHPRVPLPYMRWLPLKPFRGFGSGPELWGFLGIVFPLQVLGFQSHVQFPRAFSLQLFSGTRARENRVSSGSMLRHLGA